MDPTEQKASWSKRKRTDNEDELCKPSTFTLKPYAKPKSRLSTTAISTPRPQTPSLNTIIKPSTTSSAPAAAGRSPIKSKRSGILSNRRSRLNAPTFGVKTHAPLSLAAAVHGTLANKKQKPRIDVTTLEDSKPKSWFFDIYEETEEQQNFTVMTHSADNLDISDDERNATKDNRGKENIPPSEIHTGAAPTHATNGAISTQPATSRKDMMTDEPRTPLSDLNPSEYYAEGYDASSVVLVADEEEQQKNTTSSLPVPVPSSNNIDEILSSADFSFHAPPPAAGNEVQAQDNSLMTKSELTDLLLAATPAAREEHSSLDDAEAGLFHNNNEHDGADTAVPTDIEIWESGSAKDEVNDMETGDRGIFAEL